MRGWTTGDPTNLLLYVRKTRRTRARVKCDLKKCMLHLSVQSTHHPFVNNYPSHGNLLVLLVSEMSNVHGDEFWSGCTPNKIHKTLILSKRSRKVKDAIFCCAVFVSYFNFYVGIIASQSDNWFSYATKPKADITSSWKYLRKCVKWWLSSNSVQNCLCAAKKKHILNLILNNIEIKRHWIYS